MKLTDEEKQDLAAKQKTERAQKSEEKKKDIAAKDKKRKAEQSGKLTDVEKKDKAEKNKIKKAQQSEEKNKDIADKDRKRKSGQRTKVAFKEALKSQEILDGSYEVLALQDSEDNIGQMNIVCQYCNALKFKRETASTCCNNGKVILEKLPQPPEQINKLWHDETPEGRLFRQNARSINNAVCLTSIKGKQRSFGGGPSNVVYQGKVKYLVGPLQAAQGEKPCFAQLYVHDPNLETGLRLSGMTLPAGTSLRQKKILKQVLAKVQADLHKCNPFVRDFKQIMELDEAELGQGQIVISAKARPTGEHERRYNQQVSYMIFYIMEEFKTYTL